MGILSVQGCQPLRCGERERAALLALASGAAAVLRTAILPGEVQAVAEKLRRIEEVSRRLKLAESKGSSMKLCWMP